MNKSDPGVGNHLGLMWPSWTGCDVHHKGSIHKTASECASKHTQTSPVSWHRDVTGIRTTEVRVKEKTLINKISGFGSNKGFARQRWGIRWPPAGNTGGTKADSTARQFISLIWPQRTEVMEITSSFPTRLLILISFHLSCFLLPWVCGTEAVRTHRPSTSERFGF